MSTEDLEPVEPILLIDTYRALHKELMSLLRALDREAWQRPTVHPGWTVLDVAAHLLDGDLRRLSMQRDRHVVAPEEPIASDADLLRFLNRLNADWLQAARRLSPRVVVDWMEIAGRQVADFFAAVDPFAEELFPVAWAGQERSPNWFDIAREFTEKWIHQQEIRDAVDAPALDSRRYLHPVLDTFLRALPYTYRDVEAPAGTQVEVEITGEAGGCWTLCRGDLSRDEEGWTLFRGSAPEPTASVRLDQDTAWRLFSTRRRKGELVDRAELHGVIELHGEVELARPALDLVAVMA